MALSGGPATDTKKTPRSSVNRTALLLIAMMALTAVAKLLGMLRTARLAALFGVGMEAEALAAAGRLPNLVFELLPAAAISGCFMPVLGQKGTDKRGFTTGFGTIFLLFLTLIALLCRLLAAPLTGVLFPGLSREATALTIDLFARYALTLIPMGGAAMLTACCQAKGRYLIPPLAGLTANGIELMTLYTVSDLSPKTVVTIRLVTLWLTCAILAYPFRRLRRLCPQRGLRPLKQAAKRLPAALATTVLLPISLSAAMAAASYEAGGTALFGYAAPLFAAALGITVSGIVNYSFPKLAAEADPAARKHRATACLVTVWVISLPLALLLCLLAPETVALLYRRGRMSGQETFAVARLLSIMALALPFCVTEEYLGRLALITNRRKAALLPSILGGIAVVILSNALRPLGMTGGAVAFLLCHVLSAVLQGYLLRSELSDSPLRALPYLLWGLAALCLVYRWAARMLAPYNTANPLLLPPTAVILGGILYLTVCRFTLGRERSDPLP